MQQPTVIEDKQSWLVKNMKPASRPGKNMNIRKLIQQAMLLLVLITISCQSDNVSPADVIKKLPKTKVSSLASEPYLKDIFDKVGFEQTKNGRKSSLGTNVNTDSVLMALQADGFSYSYTFKVEGNGKNGSFTNLVFKRVVGGVKAFYLRYEPDKPYQFDLKTFTGKVTSFDLDMKEISSQDFVNGSLVPNKAGRTQGCQPTVSVTSECTSDDGKSTATGADLPCLYGTQTTVITLDYSNCLLTDSAGPGGGGNLPSGYTQWSNGTFVKFEYFNNGGPGGGQIGGGGSGSCGGEGASTLSSGSDPNSCSDVIVVYPPIGQDFQEPYPPTQDMIDRFQESVNKELFNRLIGVRDPKRIEEIIQEYGEGVNYKDALNKKYNDINGKPNPWAQPQEIYLVGYNITGTNPDGSQAFSLGTTDYLGRRAEHLEWEGTTEDGQGNGSPYFLSSFGGSGSLKVDVYVIYHTHDPKS
jgi:hypothetical protein